MTCAASETVKRSDVFGEQNRDLINPDTVHFRKYLTAFWQLYLSMATQNRLVILLHTTALTNNTSICTYFGFEILRDIVS